MATQTTPATQSFPQTTPGLRDSHLATLPVATHGAGTIGGRRETGEVGPSGDPASAAMPSAAGRITSGGSRRGHVAHEMSPLGTEDAELLALNPVIERLPVEMEVAIPVRRFRVRDLLAMAPGVVIETQWAPGEDLPLSSGEVQLAWSEFEVVDTRLAVRVTRLS